MDSETGKMVTPMADRLVDEHFNCMLDGVGQWKRTTRTADASLMGWILSIYFGQEDFKVQENV